MREEIAVFKRRAEEAFDSVQLMMERGYYDWAIVMLEQALQLLVKYYLAKTVGYFSKTHNLRKLLEEAGSLDERFSEFYKKHMDAIEVISDAYISGRYLPRRYTKEEIEGKLDLYRELLEIVES